MRKLTTVLTFRVTTEDEARIRAAAARDDRPMGAWLRRVVLRAAGAKK
jgi:hypothetical protein